jgi:hypothetical protein
MLLTGISCTFRPGIKRLFLNHRATIITGPRMGIPRLRQLLEPYTKRIELEDQRVVIDGPGLAYHIFSLCQARAPSGSPFDQPSYTLLGEKVITWLDDLTSSGAVLYIYVLLLLASRFANNLAPDRLFTLMDTSLPPRNQSANAEWWTYPKACKPISHCTLQVCRGQPRV